MSDEKKGKGKHLVTPIEAYLNLPAFLAIVTSSVEVFKKETIGYLIGVKGKNKFNPCRSINPNIRTSEEFNIRSRSR